MDQNQPPDAKPELKAVVVGPGRTLFEYVEGVQVRRGLGDAAPDLLVLPASRPAKLDKVLKAAGRLPDWAWTPARTGAGWVVFDAACEGEPAQDGLIDDLHGLMSAIGAPLHHAVYITQDRQFEADYARVCVRRGITPGMAVLNDDYWIRRLLAEFETQGRQIFETRLEAYRARTATRARAFVSLNLTPRPTKLLFLLSLLRDGLWDRGFISFGGLDRGLGKGKTPEERKAQLAGAAGFQDLALALEPNLARLESVGEVLLGDGAGSRTSDGVPKLSEDAALPEYGRSWFSVVTETEMRPRPSRVTEKPFKPLANFHPFLVLGNPGSLAFLRSLGFETFGEIFDEAYDDEPDPRRRFEMVYGQVQRLCALTDAELGRLDQAVSRKVIHNAAHLFTRLPLSFGKAADARLVQRLGERGVAPP